MSRFGNFHVSASQWKELLLGISVVAPNSLARRRDDILCNSRAE